MLDSSVAPKLDYANKPPGSRAARFVATISLMVALLAGCGDDGLKASEATCADFNDASSATQERLVQEMFDASAQKDTLPRDQWDVVRDAILGGTRITCPKVPDEPLIRATTSTTAQAPTDTIGPIDASDAAPDASPAAVDQEPPDQFLTPRSPVSFTYGGFDYEASVARSYLTVESNALVSSAKPGSTWLMVHVTITNLQDDRAVPVIYNPFLIRVGIRDAVAVSPTEEPCEGAYCSASANLGSETDGELDGVPCSTCEIPAAGETTLVLATPIAEDAGPDDVRLFMRDIPSHLTVKTPADGRLT